MLGFYNILFAQEDTKIGINFGSRGTTQGAFYDYSDPETINIKVAVWGYVRYPGRYIIPFGTTSRDLLSYAGGPDANALLEKLKIYRVDEEGKDKIIELNYNKLLWEDDASYPIENIELQAGDVLLVPGEPRLFFREYLSIILSITSTLISLSILILNISRR